MCMWNVLTQKKTPELLKKKKILLLAMDGQIIINWCMLWIKEGMKTITCIQLIKRERNQ